MSGSTNRDPTQRVLLACVLRTPAHGQAFVLVSVRDHCFDVWELRLVNQRRAICRVEARVVVELAPRAACLPSIVDADVREPELQQRRAAGLVDDRIDGGFDARLGDIAVVAVPRAPPHRPGAVPIRISELCATDRALGPSRVLPRASGDGARAGQKRRGPTEKSCVRVVWQGHAG